MYTRRVKGIFGKFTEGSWTIFLSFIDRSPTPWFHTSQKLFNAYPMPFIPHCKKHASGDLFSGDFFSWGLFSGWMLNTFWCVWDRGVKRERFLWRPFFQETVFRGLFLQGPFCRGFFPGDFLRGERWTSFGACEIMQWTEKVSARTFFPKEHFFRWPNFRLTVFPGSFF